MKVSWTRLALSDLNKAREFIAQESPSSATYIVDRIEQACRALSEHPQIGRRGRVGGTLELVISGIPFILVYRLKNQRIEVLSMIHSSRKWPEKL